MTARAPPPSFPLSAIAIHLKSNGDVCVCVWFLWLFILFLYLSLFGHMYLFWFKYALSVIHVVMFILFYWCCPYFVSTLLFLNSVIDFVKQSWAPGICKEWWGRHCINEIESIRYFKLTPEWTEEKRCVLETNWFAHKLTCSMTNHENV